MTQKLGLSGRQEKILRAIQEYTDRFNRPPTFREIKEAVGLKSIGAVSYQVANLEEMALVTRERNVARGLTVTEQARAFLGKAGAAVAQATGVVRFQIAGDIGASTPVEMGNGTFATYDEDDNVAIDASLLPKRTDDLFAVRVRGNSMVDALIGDRDVVILQKVAGSGPRDGDMVAAWLRLEQELTLKRFYLEGDMVRLQPANPTMGPIYSPASNVEVQARVVSVIRQAAGRRV